VCLNHWLKALYRSSGILVKCCLSSGASKQPSDGVCARRTSFAERALGDSGGGAAGHRVLLAAAISRTGDAMDIDEEIAKADLPILHVWAEPDSIDYQKRGRRAPWGGIGAPLLREIPRCPFLAGLKPIGVYLDASSKDDPAAHDGGSLFGCHTARHAGFILRYVIDLDLVDRDFRHARRSLHGRATNRYADTWTS
jgi:hypothetical protein